MNARLTNKVKRPYPPIYVNLKLQNPNVFRAAGRLLNITAMLTHNDLASNIEDSGRTGYNGEAGK
jgi:hypothetical protein